MYQYARPVGKDYSQAFPNGLNGYPYKTESGYPNSNTQPAGRAIQFNARQPPMSRPVISPPLSLKSKKLRKPKPDGYESDGGYVSESGKNKKDKKKNTKKSPSQPSAEILDSGYTTDVTSRKERKKSKKEKERKVKTSDTPAVGYDTDAAPRLRWRKESFTSPLPPEESDGGYISEASGKKRRFFLLNARSPRKKDATDSNRHEVIPPMPDIPQRPLPIVERFIRSPTPASTVDTSTSRTPTPVPGIAMVADKDQQSSINTFFSVAEQPDAEDSLSMVSSFDGLTKAFRDAESVRSPSIDMLSTFAGRARMTRLRIGEPRGSKQSLAWETSSESVLSPPFSPDAPIISQPKSSSSRPLISAPNTSLLSSPKHVPAPLNLSSGRADRILPARPSPDPDYVVVTPAVERPITPITPVTPMTPDPPPTPTKRMLNVQTNSLFLRRSPSPSLLTPSSSATPSSTVSQQAHQQSQSQTLIRPHILAYYDLPPPSPPPFGPLPDVPPSPGKVQFRPPSTAFAPSQGYIPRNVSLDSGRSSTPPRSRSPIAHPTPSRPTPDLKLLSPPPLKRTESAPVTGSTPAIPLLSQPTPRIQRGRESPFPSAPILPRDKEDVTELLRKTIPATPGTAAPVISPAQTVRNVQAAVVDTSFSGPASASPSLEGQRRAHQQQLGVHWQPRSASVLERRRQAEGRRSWMPFSEKGMNKPFADVPVSGRSSLVDLEDDELQNGNNAGIGGVPASPAASTSTFGGAGAARGTVYYSGDEAEANEPGDENEDGRRTNRNSVWSSNTHASFMDNEKSEKVREQFVRRVEAMYGDGSGNAIPPVPSLPRTNSSQRSGSI